LSLSKRPELSYLILPDRSHISLIRVTLNLLKVEPVTSHDSRITAFHPLTFMIFSLDYGSFHAYEENRDILT
jgi:hypothetical protein